jgi:transcriptional regulator NrdR family protein
MNCPGCDSQRSRVLDTRVVEGAIRRRRECWTCGERFTTYERPDVAATELERAVVEFVRSLDAPAEEGTRCLT